MNARILAAILIASFVAVEVRAAEFSYSITSGPTCANIKSKREFNSWRCPGPAGYSALFHDLGNMVAVEFGPIGKEKAIIEDGLLWQGAEKAFGDKVEWRMTGGKPYAAILRIRRQDFDDKVNAPRTVEELLVIKISPQGACRISGVDGKWPDANALAQEVADTMAIAFRCGTDQPRTPSAARAN